MNDQEFRERYGPWALVAGASEGLGAEFARQLARRGLNVALLARSQDKLEALARTLREEHHVDARPLAVDLARADLLEAIRPGLEGLEIGLYVHNAAASSIGPFLDQSLASQLAILDVNCRAPLLLSHHLGRAMGARGRGGIILMTSLAAGQGGPFLAAYSASKAWNLVFGEALWGELGARGVDVLACRAGATRTPAYERSRPVGSVPLMEPAAVVAASLAGLGSRPSLVAGATNYLASLFMDRLLPRRAAVGIMASATRKLYRDRTG